MSEQNTLFGEKVEVRTGFDHDRDEFGKDEWLTPPQLVKDLGEFDLDPCSPITRPWDTAKRL